MPQNVPFVDRLPSIEVEILKRRSKWTFAQLEFEDVSQILKLRIFNKYHTFDETRGEFSHWVNTVITHCINNILRDNYTKFARPCVMRCAFNTGIENCSYTPSGKQCEECPLYAAWAVKKRDQHNINLPVAIENHVDEYESVSQDFLDIDAAKTVIDDKIRKKLKPVEWNVYELLFIENKDENEAASILGYKMTGGKRCKQIQNIKKNIVAMAKEVIDEENLA